jgi:hypothetical protein
MLTLSAVEHLVRKRLPRYVARDPRAVARRSWEIAPGSSSTPARALFLPNQLERVTGWTFSNGHPGRAMESQDLVSHAPTRGFLIENAWLIDGMIYKGDAASFLTARSSRLPRLRVDREIARGAVYCTSGGNRYFGQWLMDDCPTYPLAVAEGLPITTNQPVNPHTRGYEERLDMAPTRLDVALLRELILFDDVGQNPDKHRRCLAMADKVRGGARHDAHPGVFILRGSLGQRRLLQNELEVAHHLRDRRGLRVLDPEQCDVATIIATCAGARMVVGVEGSGLMHGIMHLPAGGGLLVLQPPNRFVPLYKDLTDRDGQHFGFVVGTPDGPDLRDFRVDIDEVERTLDLFPLLPR